MRYSLWAAALVGPLVFSSVLPAQNPRRSGQDREIRMLERLQRAQLEVLRTRAALRDERRDGVLRTRLDESLRALTAAESLLRRRLGLAAPTPRAGSTTKSLKPRRAASRRFGAADPKQVGRAIEAGLLWLRSHQDEDGRWDADGYTKHNTPPRKDPGAGNPVHDVGVTGLALLALMADGSSPTAGPHHKHIRKGLQWLRKQQGRSGLLGSNASHDFVYDHAIATWALCEAYGLHKTGFMAEPAQRALNYLEMHRNPYAVWRYQPRDNENDTSVTSWCAQALAAGNRHGLRVNPTAIKAALAYLDEVSDPKTGKIGYTKRGEGSSRHPGDHARRFPQKNGAPLTAAGLGLRLALGQKPAEEHSIKLATNLLLGQTPTPSEPGTIDHYYWFHGSLALRRIGGAAWQRWSRALAATALPMQRQRGPHKGSWDPAGVWGKDGGRVYATAMLCISLRLLQDQTILLR